LESNDCSFGVVLGVLRVVSVGSVVSELLVAVGPEDVVSSGLTRNQTPSAPSTSTKTPAAATIGTHGTLLPLRGGPGGGGAAVHIGPLGGGV
jgi:ABC-type hemin transport system substrate-binding protein